MYLVPLLPSPAPSHRSVLTPGLCSPSEELPGLPSEPQKDLGPPLCFTYTENSAGVYEHAGPQARSTLKLLSAVLVVSVLLFLNIFFKKSDLLKKKTKGFVAASTHSSVTQSVAFSSSLRLLNIRYNIKILKGEKKARLSQDLLHREEVSQGCALQPTVVRCCSDAAHSAQKERTKLLLHVEMRC